MYERAIAGIKEHIGDDCDLYYIASHPFDIMGAAVNGFRTILVDATDSNSEEEVVRASFEDTDLEVSYVVHGLADVPSLFK